MGLSITKAISTRFVVLQGLEYCRDVAKTGLYPQLTSPDPYIYDTSIIRIGLPTRGFVWWEDGAWQLSSFTYLFSQNEEAGGEGGRGSDSQQRRLVSERWQQSEEPYSWHGALALIGLGRPRVM